MIVKRLTDKQVEEMRAGSNRFWLEGLDLEGYWELGDSFIFSYGKRKVCISRGFLEELLTRRVKQIGGRSSTAGARTSRFGSR